MRNYSLLILALLFTNSFAQKIIQVDLQQAIEMAKTQNLEIKEKSCKIKLAENQLSEVSKNYFLPKLTLRNANGLVPGLEAVKIDSIHYAYSKKSEDTYSNWGPFTDFKLEAIQPIFTFGKLTSLKEAAKANVKVETFEFEDKKSELAFNVKKYYWSCILADEFVNLAKETEKKIREAKEKVEKKLANDEDDVSQSDIFKIRLKETEVQSKKRQAETGKKLALEVLKLSLGLDFSDSLVLVQKVLETLETQDFSLEELTQNSLVFRPDFQKLQFGLKAKKSLIKDAKSELYPQFFIAAEYKFNKTPGRDDVDNPFLVDNSNYSSYSAVVGFKQELNFHLLTNKVEKAKLNYQELLLKEAYSKKGISLQVKKAFLEFEDLKQKVSELEKMEKMTSGWYKTTASDYDLGFGELDELVDAFTAKTQTKQELLQAIFDFNLALARLEKACGKELRKN